MRSFSQMLQNLKASESATYDAVLETLAYIHSQYHAGRVVDGAGNLYWPQFTTAIATKWLANALEALKPRGKKEGRINVEDMALRLAPEVSAIINGRKEFNAEKKAAAQIKRNAAKEKSRLDAIKAYEDEIKEAEEIAKGEKFVVSPDTLILAEGENAFLLTREEYNMLATMLMQMRQRNAEKDVTPEMRRLAA